MPRSKRAEGQVLEGRRRGINTGLHYTCSDGRIVIGPEWRNILGSVFLIAAPVGIFFGFEANAIGTSISWACPAVIGALFLASLATLFCTAFVDPGFLPRDSEMNQPDESGLSKEYTINGYTVQTKWCSTCNHYRPPRCSHCAVCDNCVLKFDHHCPWVGTCVGERNYPFFMAFLFLTTALDCLVFSFCWVRLVYLVNHDQKTWKQAVKHEPALVALIIYTFIFFFFVGGLFSLHIFFTTQNTTTYEHFRSRYNRQGNPYDKGLFSNWANVCCRRPPPRLKEKLPFRVVTDDGVSDGSPVSSAQPTTFQGNGHHAQYLEYGNPLASHQDVELSNMEEARPRHQGVQTGGRSIATTFDDTSDDERSAVSQRRIPMVGSLGGENGTLLDSSESESDFSEADHIRSHHSVVVLPDDPAAGSAVVAPPEDGQMSIPESAEEKVHLSADAQTTLMSPPRLSVDSETVSVSSHKPSPDNEALSDSPNRLVPSGGTLPTSTDHGATSSNRLNLDRGNLMSTVAAQSQDDSQVEWAPLGQGMAGSASQVPVLDPDSLPTLKRFIENAVPSAVRSQPVTGNTQPGRTSIAPIRGGAMSNDQQGTNAHNQLADAFEVGTRPQQSAFDSRLRNNVRVPSKASMLDASDDETCYGTPRAMSVWPSSDVDSFRTAVSATGDLETPVLTPAHSVSRLSLTSTPATIKAQDKRG